MLPLKILGRALLNETFNKTSPILFAVKTQPLLGAAPGVLGGMEQLRWHSVNRDLKTNFNWKRERPVGPNKAKTPNVCGGKSSPNYRHIIHYPEDGKYTINKLDVTKLGGRHPVTGRKVIQGVRGGSKQKARWIDWHRLPSDFPRDGSVLEERVILIKYDPMRDSKIALTGYGDHLRWQIATDKVKEGDIIRTHTEIPRNPIRPVEGDAHPIGALPMGSTVCLVEGWPGEGARFAWRAEDNVTVLRKVGDRVVIKMWDRIELAVPVECMCVVGTVSIHPLKALPIGSPNRARWLGIGPRSGLWKRKDGRSGKKNRPPPPVEYTTPMAEYMKDAGTPMRRYVGGPSILCEAMSEGARGRLARGTKVIKEGSQWYQPGHQ